MSIMARERACEFYFGCRGSFTAANLTSLCAGGKISKTASGARCDTVSSEGRRELFVSRETPFARWGYDLREREREQEKSKESRNGEERD